MLQVAISLCLCVCLYRCANESVLPVALLRQLSAVHMVVCIYKIKMVPACACSLIAKSLLHDLWNDVMLLWSLAKTLSSWHSLQMMT